MMKAFRNLIRWLGDVLRPVFPYWLLIVVAGFAIGPHPGKRTALECFAFLILLAALWRIPGLRLFITRLSRGYRALLLTAIGLILIGQVVGSNRTSYPFPQWNMYTGADPPNTYYEYTGVFTPTGETAQFPFHEAAPNRSTRAFMARFNSLVESVESFDAPAGADTPAIDSLRKDLRTLMRIYNTRHPHTPVRSIAIARHTIPVSGYDGKGSVEIVPLIRVEATP